MHKPKEGFFAALFDIKFEEFITIKLVRFMYALSILTAAAAGIMIIIKMFMTGFAAGIFGLILGPLTAFMMVLFSRVTFEMIIVLFRIAEDIGDMAENSRGPQGEDEELL